MHTRTLCSVMLISTSFLVVACDQQSDPNSTDRGGTSATPAIGSDADNTARNKVDRDTSTKTPMDQSNSSEAIRITADIRRAIMEDDSMSMNAQNCKIITDERGTVTLRGPVTSQAEKEAIESKAQAVAGVNRVINELEVERD